MQTFWSLTAVVCLFRSDKEKAAKRRLDGPICLTIIGSLAYITMVILPQQD
jgi:hypothetical protein